MVFLFPLAAFALVLLAAWRSLGWGFVAVVAVGYFNGIIRANYLGVFTTFMFDCAVLGLYAGFLAAHGGRMAGMWSGTAVQFLLLLVAWPALLALIPVNDFLVQLVSLRAAVWYIPVVLIATRLTAADLTALARGLAVLNLIALVGGVYTYLYGIEELYPRNAITELMYRSKDVGGFTYYRVPSFFLSAHAYGGTMLLSLPLLLGRLFASAVRMWERGLTAAGAAAAVAGILMCAARSPALTLLIAILVTWACTRFNAAVAVVAVGLVAAAGVAVVSNERFQRSLETLQEPDQLTGRVYSSANESSLQLLWAYPGGAGLGSASSIPYFLADRAPTQVPLENEYSRIQVEQGWVGLAAWLAFLGWLFVRPPRPALGVPWQLGAILMYAVALTSWATAAIGTGLTAAIPQTVLLFAQMGVLIQVRERGAVRGAVRAPAPPPAGGPR